MVENIALMLEVQQGKSIKTAEHEANSILNILEIDVATKRQNQCTQLELFYVMIVRAFLSKFDRVIIVMPFTIVKNLLNLHEVFKKIKQLKQTKECIVIDLNVNKNRYERLDFAL
ncbi:hypothetical protein MNB_SM-6-904 [hydrothermal vent metagenome]|uniref:Uncharacterized protein n=1 Tax=hydrothermal vent metagenome TaxID=652676 RepID=A0A1W1CSE3_9ZZZZ